MTALQLAKQVTKYSQRGGWSHRDLLRLSHAKAKTPELNSVLHYAVKGWDSIGPDVPTEPHLAHMWAVEKAKRASDVKEVVTLIERFELVREEIGTQWLREKEVWDALLQKMPMTALIRNLATMSRVGLLVPMSEAGKIVCERLRNKEIIRKARVHPIQVLSALRTYSNGGQGGYGIRSTGGSYEVLPSVKAALEAAFYGSFGNVEATGKRTLLALDVSASMDGGQVAGVPGLTPRDASMAMAMVTARSEWSDGDVSYPLYHSVAFTDKLIPFALAPTDTLEDVTRRASKLPFGGTDCSAPLLYALDKGIAVDTFVIYTDNECWAGKIHPSEALKRYRRETGIPSRLAVIGLTATNISIADPTDAGMLDVCGFDTAAPGLISSFSRGEL